MSSKFALIIGNSTYGDSRLSQLQAPKTDVASLSRVLSDLTIGNFENIVQLVDEPLSVVQKEIARFFRHKKRSDLLLLYFSGHGVLDTRGRLYLAVTDTEHDLLSGTALPAHFIRDEMMDCLAKSQVVMLDCCHSSAFDRGTKVALGSSVGTKAIFESSGHVVLTATDALQVALDSDSPRGIPVPSVFTRYLIEGLETGHADLNGDGLVTLDELYEFTYNKVIADETTSQTPIKIGKQQGQLVLALNPFIKKQQKSPLNQQEQRSFEILQKAYEDWITFDRQDHRLMDAGTVDLVLQYVSEPVLPIHLLEYLVCSIANLRRVPENGANKLKNWFTQVGDTKTEDLIQRLLLNPNSRIREWIAVIIQMLNLRDAIAPLVSTIENDSEAIVRTESIKALYELGAKLPGDVVNSLIESQNDWIVKTLALQSTVIKACLLIGDGSEYADELGNLAKKAGLYVITTPDVFATSEILRHGGYNFVKSFKLIILVRGEHYSSLSGDEFYLILSDYVARGGHLFATSWVSWETYHSKDRTYFGKILPFLHVNYLPPYMHDFVEDVPIDCKPTENDLAHTLFPKPMSYRSSFETLEKTEDSTVLLETDIGIPIFGFRQVEKGKSFYLNTCQHSCTSYMPSPLNSCPELRDGLEKFFKWFTENREYDLL